MPPHHSGLSRPGAARVAGRVVCPGVLLRIRAGDASVFKEGWVQYYDLVDVPDMDTVIQSWDTAQSKSSSSSYVVGQVWGRDGGDFYLLDQIRGRLDFDETVKAIHDLSERWPQSTAKLVEAQALGAAVVAHLKHTIPGLIPITVEDPKETRALNCVPVWQSKNVYVPKPDDGKYVWGSASTCRSF